jgi:hypothetical protein
VADSRWLSITLDCPALCPDCLLNYSRGGPIEPESGLFGRTVAELSHAPNYLVGDNGLSGVARTNPFLFLLCQTFLASFGTTGDDPYHFYTRTS